MPHKKTWSCIKPDGDGCDGDHINDTFERELADARHRWRAFHCDEHDGACLQSPDETFAYAYRAALTSSLVKGMAVSIEILLEDANFFTGDVRNFTAMKQLHEALAAYRAAVKGE